MLPICTQPCILLFSKQICCFFYLGYHKSSALRIPQPNCKTSVRTGISLSQPTVLLPWINMLSYKLFLLCILSFLMLTIKIVFEKRSIQQMRNREIHLLLTTKPVYTTTAEVFTRLQALVLSGACLQLVTGKLQWRKAVGRTYIISRRPHDGVNEMLLVWSGVQQWSSESWSSAPALQEMVRWKAHHVHDIVDVICYTDIAVVCIHSYLAISVQLHLDNNDFLAFLGR